MAIGSQTRRLVRLVAWGAVGLALAYFAVRGIWRGAVASGDLAVGYGAGSAWLQGLDPYAPEVLKAQAMIGSNLKLMATPSYVIQGVAILGHPGLEPLRKVIAAARACKKVVC